MADVIDGLVVELGASTNIDPALVKARNAMAALEGEARRLADDLQAGAISTAQFNARTMELSATQQKLAGAMQAAYTRTAGSTSALGTAMEGMGVSGGNTAMKMMLVAQTADDMQYGFKSIVNNIPGVLTSFGMGAGLAGGLSILAVGINQVINHWGMLEEAFGTGFSIPALTGLEAMESKLKGVSKELEELRKGGKLSLPEFGRLKQLEGEEKALKDQVKARKELDTLLGASSKEEKARGSAFAEAVAESGGSMALDALISGLRDQANEKGEVGVLGAAVGMPQQVAEELFVNAARGDVAAIESIRKAIPGSSFAGRIEALSPAGKARTAERAKIAEDVAAQSYMDEFAAEGGLEGPGKKERDEIAKGQAADRAKMAAEVEAQSLMEEFEAGGGLEGMSPKDMDRHARLTEKGSDLQWNLFRLMNPNQEVRQLAGDAYAASLHGSTGISEEAKRLHDIYEIEKQIAENTQNLKNVGQARRVRR